MTDIATTNGHQKTGRKKTLTEAEALAAITAANDQVRSAQQALDKCVTDQAAKKAAHEAASADNLRAGLEQVIREAS